MRLRLIACDTLLAPMRQLAAASVHEVVITDLSASLHAEPLPLRARIQAEIDRLEAEDGEADAILLGYGLCGGATAGLVARRRPLVLPRAHDCATLFLGSRERYVQEHTATPGTYWFTEDNVERGNALLGWQLGDAARADGARTTYQAFVERYGEDNAAYLMDTLGAWRTRYERGAFLETGLAAGDRSREEARRESEARGWRFEAVAADLGLLERLLAGQWEVDFLVVAPGETVAMSYDDGVVRAAPSPVAAAAGSSRPARKAAMNSTP
jgi:hypothetical protein